MAVQTEDAAKHPTSARWHIRSLRCIAVRLGYSQNDGATISWSVERLLEGFDMSRRPLLFCRDAILLAACRAAPAFNSPCRRSQTLRRDAALVSRPKEQATRPRVLLWVRLGHHGPAAGCPSAPNNRHRQPDWLCPKSAITRFMQRSKNTWLTDQLVGAGAASEHPFRPSFFAVANHLIVVSIEQKRPPTRDRKNCKHVTDREQNDKRLLRIDTAWSGFSVATQVIAEQSGS
jgi:hypothetical protein